LPFALRLPEPWASRGWKAKIRDRERLEDPHVTILYKTSAWRFDLRSERFLDKDPSPRKIPEQLLGAVRAKLGLLRQEWDRMFPENRVFSQEREDERNVEPEGE
jgi:hypothetical protein